MIKFYIYFLLLILIILSESIIHNNNNNNNNPFLILSSSLSILKNRKGISKNNDKDSIIVEFDEYGGLPQLKNTLIAVSKGSTIVAIRTNNSTILGYAKSLKQNELEISINNNNLLYSLGNQYQYILVTGIIGDCRAICRYAKQITLNHTIEFDHPPSGLYIANEIARYLQKFTMSGTRPMAVHIFIADSIVNGINIDDNNQIGKLYEIDPTGNVMQIKAGCAGINSIKGKEILENEIIDNISYDDALILAKKILLQKFTNNNSNDTNINNELNEYIYNLSDVK